jgi:copper transport protein
MRAAAWLIVIVMLLAQAGAAWAHASLLRAEPADGSVVPEAPARLALTFNEPVSPLLVRLIAPDGSVTTPKAEAENATVTIRPVRLQQGTHVLSWRVVSADGHPVGGSLMFSVGAASARTPQGMLPAAYPGVRAAFWAVKFVIYVVLLIGIGGAFFRAWFLAPPTDVDGSSSAVARAGEQPDRSSLGPCFRADERNVDRVLTSLIALGLVAAPLSVGLQGLDALDAALPALASSATWTAGLATTYGNTIIVTVVGFLAGLVSLKVPPQAARGLALAALVVSGLALTLSGHASNAPPQWLTRPAVFLHVVCVVLWIGALLPLSKSVGGGRSRPLARFTHVVPFLLVGIIVSGATLALRQLDRLDALWTTSYGVVLSCKLAGVAMLLGLGALNRYILVPHYRSQGTTAAVPLMRSIAAEVAIAAAIVALVALWRFTPPPRALAAAEPIELHFHGQRAMAQLTITPVRARPPHINIQVLDAELQPLAVKEVTLSLANPAQKIEPVRLSAAQIGALQWRVDGLRVPMSGQWVVRVDLLIDEFEKVVLEEEVHLPRLP